MKLIKLSFLLTGICVFISGTLVGQENIAKVTPIGLFTNTNGSFGAGYSIGAGLEHVFTDQVTGQINIGGVFKGGSGIFNRSRFLMKPEFAMYIMEYAPYGLYLGGFTTFGFGNYGTFIGLGPQVGYQVFFLDDQLTVDLNFEAGVAINAGVNIGSTFGFHSFTGVSVGYAF